MLTGVFRRIRPDLNPVSTTIWNPSATPIIFVAFIVWCILVFSDDPWENGKGISIDNNPSLHLLCTIVFYLPSWFLTQVLICLVPRRMGNWTPGLFSIFLVGLTISTISVFFLSTIGLLSRNYMNVSFFILPLILLWSSSSYFFTKMLILFGPKGMRDWKPDPLSALFL